MILENSVRNRGVENLRGLNTCMNLTAFSLASASILDTNTVPSSAISILPSAYSSMI
jgi:hypothetical protein